MVFKSLLRLFFSGFVVAIVLYGYRLEAQSVVVNSYFNSASPNQEWVELVVLEDNLDITNWTLRDNDSDQRKWMPEITFFSANNPTFWKNLRRGTIIVIQNRKVGISSSDFNNIKADGFLRIGADDPNYFSGGSFADNKTLNIASSGDIIQIRNSLGQNIHSLGHKSTPDSCYNYIDNNFKINHFTNLPQNNKLSICPGGSAEQFIEPNSNKTAVSMDNISGYPTSCIASNSENSNFRRQKRQPDWVNQSVIGAYHESTNKIDFTWQTMNDLNPIDNTMGYLILRCTTNSFIPPTDGITYPEGQSIGLATVAKVLINSNNNYFSDTYNLNCGESVYYRIYGFRYLTDYNGVIHVARGRAYNEDNYAEIIATRTALPATVSINASPTGVVPAGTNVTFTPTPVNGGPAPTYTWYVNGSQWFIGSPFVYAPSNGDQVVCVMTSNAGCVSNNPATSNTIIMQVTPACNPGNILGQPVMCLNTTQTFSTTGDAGGVWSSSNAAVISINSSSGLATAHTAGLATITYTVSGCAGVPITPFLCTVNPNAQAGADQNLCDALTTTLQGNTPFAGNGFWIQQTGPGIATILPDIYSPTVNVTVSQPGTYDFSWNFSEGSCSTSDIVTVQFNPRLPVSVSINPVNTNICQGSAVSLQALPVNGGSPSYNWYVNGIMQTNHSQIFGFTPLDGDEVYVQMTSSLGCVSDNPAESNMLTFTVSPTAAVSASITASSNNICAGTPVTFQLQTVNAGSNPDIRWYKNANQVQFGGTTYTDVPSNGDVYRATATSLNSCAANNPANSNNITMVVNATSMASINLSSSPSPACSNVPVTISTSIANGGSTPQYVWYLNDAVWPGVTFPNYTYFASPGDRIRVQLTSNQPCVLNSPVLSAEFVPNILQAAIAPTDLVSDRNNYCANDGGNITLTANGGAGDEVKWYGGSCGATLLHTGATYTLQAPVVTTNFYARWETASCGVSACKTITINVLPSVTPTIGISATTSTICSGENVVFTASATGTGPAPLYQWKVNGSIVQSSTANVYASSLLQNNDKVSCTLLSDNACAAIASVTSNEITMVVTTLIVPQLQITSSQTSACSGLPVDFTIGTSTGGGSAPQYQWKKNGIPQPGETGTSYSTNFSSNGSVSCEMTSNAGCVSQPIVQSNTINISVTQTVTPAIVIQGPVNPAYCEGQTILFTSNSTNGGSNPTYQWYVDNAIWPGAINANFNTSALSPGSHQIHCVLHSSSPCASVPNVSSNTVFITVEQFVLPVAVITAPQTNFCPGEQASFTAAVSNQGSTPTYQWLVNNIPQAGQTNLSFSFQPTVNAAVSFILTSSVYCVSDNPVNSNVINIVAHPTANVAVSVAASQSDVCAGEMVQFTATPQNGGSNPAYTWFVNDVIAGSNSNTYTYAPVAGDKVHVQLQSSVPFCTVNNPAASAPVFPAVHANPVAPAAVTASDLNVCPGETGTITLSSTGGSGDVLRWYANSCGAGAPLGEGTNIQVPVPGVTTTYYARYETTFCGESACVPVTITVSGSIEPTVQLQVSNTEPCAGEQLTVTADVTGQGGSPVFEWRLNGSPAGSNQPFYVFSPADGDQLSCTMTSSETCADPAQATDSYTFSVSPVLVPDITVSPSANGICAGTAVVFEATIANGGTNPQYQWMVNGALQGGNSNTFTYTPANAESITCQLSSNAHCASPTQIVSQAVVMSVAPVLTPEIAITADQTAICLGDFVNFGSTVQNGGSNPVYAWQVNGMDVGNAPNYTYQPDNMDVVQCVLTSSENCVSQNPVSSNSITITATTQLTPSVAIATAATTVCQGTTVVVESTIENGGVQPGYQWFVNGEEVSAEATLQYIPADGDQVYCVMTSNAGCLTTPSATSSTLVFAVEAQTLTSVSISSPQLELCEGSVAEVTATIGGGGDSPAIQWLLNGLVQTETGSTFTFTPQNGDNLQCVMTSSVMCPSVAVSNSNMLLFNILPQVSPSISLVSQTGLICVGEQVSIQANYSGGGTQPVFNWTVNGNSVGSNQAGLVYVPGNLDEVVCELTSNAACALQSSVSSEALILSVTDIVVPAVSISGGEGNLCPGTDITLTLQSTGAGDQPVVAWLRNNQPVAGSTSISIVPEPGDVISCTLTSSASCASPQQAQAIIFPQVAPGITLGAQNISAASCNENNGAFVVEAAGGITPLSFSIDNGQSWQTTAGFSNLAPGNIHLLARDNWGCQLTQPLAVVIESIPPPFINGISLTKSREGMAEGTAEVSLGDPAACQYSLDASIWQTENIFVNLNPGTYTAFVRDEQGCITQQDFEILVQFLDFEPGIPNAFRPSSVPPNNTFGPVFGNTRPEHYHMIILDSWGKVLYESTDPAQPWNGTFNGQRLQRGVYAWFIEYDLPSFESAAVFHFVRKGTVTLLD